jgi:guanylate kinase
VTHITPFSVAVHETREPQASRAEFEHRLRGRGTDAEEVIQRRLQGAAGDMGHWPEFEFVVVNDDFERALGELQAIIQGRGDASRSDRPGLAELADGLTKEETGS